MGSIVRLHRGNVNYAVCSYSAPGEGSSIIAASFAILNGLAVRSRWSPAAWLEVFEINGSSKAATHASSDIATKGHLMIRAHPVTVLLPHNQWPEKLRPRRLIPQGGSPAHGPGPSLYIAKSLEPWSPFDSSPSYEGLRLRRASFLVAVRPVTSSFSFSCTFSCSGSVPLSTPPFTHDAAPNHTRPQGPRRKSAWSPTNSHSSPEGRRYAGKAQWPIKCEESVDNGRHKLFCDVSSTGSASWAPRLW